MKKWTFEDCHFIEADGKTYILVEDVTRGLDKTAKILTEKVFKEEDEEDMDNQRCPECNQLPSEGACFYCKMD